MAKKTNKTSHVLNLLSGGGEQPVEKKIENDTVTIDDLAKEDPLAEEIKNSLIEDLGDKVEKRQVAEAQTREEVVAETAKIEEPQPQKSETTVAEEIKNSLIQDLEEEVEPIKSEEADEIIAAAAVTEAKKEIKETELVQFGEDSSSEVEVETTIEEVATTVATTSAPVKNGENEVKRLSDSLGKDEFEFLSVMEYIIEHEIYDYMKNFNVCDCSRCTADVMALALTNLPAKFVVAGKDSVSPILNFYAKKYETEVTVALTNACAQVAERPHHIRPR